MRIQIDINLKNFKNENKTYYRNIVGNSCNDFFV